MDALELWGDDDDANMFSLEIDSSSGTSIFYFNGSTSSAYLSHATMNAAVKKFLKEFIIEDNDGYIESDLSFDPAFTGIDLDALMVSEGGENDGVLDEGDRVIFSIDETLLSINVDPIPGEGTSALIESFLELNGGQVFLAEVMTGDVFSITGWLKHGNEEWRGSASNAFSWEPWNFLTNEGDNTLPGGAFRHNIDAIEALGQQVAVPEPSTYALMSSMALIGFLARRKKGRC